MLFELLSDLTQTENILFIVKSSFATSEIRSNSLKIRQKDNWITIGENDDPAHMHINSEMIKKIEFIEEEKPDRTSFSVRFFDEKGDRALAAFFTKMYDENKKLDLERKKIYVNLSKKYGKIIQL